MKLEKLKEERKKNKMTFRLKGADEVFANTIRRLIVEEVPTLAVEEVEVKDNNSALYDEMLALRVGLIPIKTDLKSYRLPENEQEIQEKSARCTLQIQLKASKKGYVYAEEAKSADPKCVFAYPTMPIVKLLSKQKVDINMTAVMGQGKEHTKWAPGLLIYRAEPTLTIGNVKDSQKIMENCPDGVFSMKGAKLSVDAENLLDSKLLEYYAELDPAIKLEYMDSLIICVESWGQLTWKEMLLTASDILIQKIEKFDQLLSIKT